jgi:hypothetical protein
MSTAVRRTARALCALAAALAATAGPAAAKGIGPGDISVCDGRRCVPVMDRGAATAAGALLYLSRQPRVAPSPRLGARSFQLRFGNGYVTGIVGSARLDRFLSYGVVLGRFRRGSWYRVPAPLARELRRLTVGLTPRPITRGSLDRSR